jgi:hypothetical protein
MTDAQVTTPPPVPVEEWGRRLTDAVRAALDAGDLERGLRLVREGDGQARSLATEYFFMFKGLLVTTRVIIDTLLAEPADGLPSLLNGFRRDFATAMNRSFDGYGVAVVPAAADDPATEAEATTELLDEGLSRFERGQRALAAGIEQAIEAGDVPGARRAVDEKVDRQFRPMHDAMIRFFADSMGWVHRRRGHEGLLRFQLVLAEGQRVGIDRWEAMPVDEFARTFVFLLKQHLGEMEVREEADHFVIDQSLCGSGGRLIASGAYEGPSALPMVEGPSPLTAGRAEFPAYCTHCPGWNAMAPEQWYGHPHVEYPDPARPDGSCLLHIPKARPNR